MDAMTYLLFIIGFVLLIRGAEWLVDGASKLGRRLGISSLVIGLTVVAFGTSLPELVVNMFSAFTPGANDLAIGNILGSNVANILLVLGLAALVRPLSVKRPTVYREVLFNVFASGLLILLVADQFFDNFHQDFVGLSRIDGVILMSYFVVFLYYAFGRRLYAKEEAGAKDTPKPDKNFSATEVAWKIIVGSAALALGGNWIVDGAITVSELIGVSTGVVGLTVVAIGTSLPELATSVIAAKNKQVDIAVGNAVGSNLFNIFWVLGLTAAIKPLPFTDNFKFGAAAVLITSIVLFMSVAFGRYKHQISKSEGRFFLALFAVFLITTVFVG